MGTFVTGFVVVVGCCCCSCCEVVSPNPPNVGLGRVDEPEKGVAELNAVWLEDAPEKADERPPAKEEDLWNEADNNEKNICSLTSELTHFKHLT
jgi:hypothetical protein